MKKALKIFCMSVMVMLLYAAGLMIGTSFPPGDGHSQMPTIHPDSTMSLSDVKALLNTAEQNNQVAKAMESVKPEKPKVIVRERKVYAPAPISHKPLSPAKPDPKPATRPAVTVIYEAPKYTGTESRDKMTYAEWKMQRGLLQGKSYSLYQKYLNNDGQGN